MEKPVLLITGSNGLIGSILRSRLIDAYVICGVDKRERSEGGNFRLDIRDFEETREIFQKVKPDFVLHLAGDANPQGSWESVYTNNILGTYNVYEAAKSAGVRRIVFASTNRVSEGNEMNLPSGEHIKATDAVKPMSYYATSKVFGEALAWQYYSQHNLESICLRIGSVYQGELPPRSERALKTWLSYRDLVQLVEKSLTTKKSFGIYYGVSNNRDRFWDISDAKTDLGYFPLDDASKISMFHRLWNRIKRVIFRYRN